MGERLAECLGLLGESCSASGCAPQLLCNVLLDARQSLGDVFCLYSRLRLALETAVQYAYYRLMGVEPGEAMERIARRSRFYASFTATMVKRLKGVHGSRKKWMLKVYLALGSWLHPSDELHRAAGRPPLDGELVLEALDAVAYAMAVSGCSIADSEVSERCGLEKTLRLLARREG